MNIILKKFSFKIHEVSKFKKNNGINRILRKNLKNKK